MQTSQSRHGYVSFWVKDDNPRVRRVLKALFRVFLILRSVRKVVQWFNKRDIKLPSRTGTTYHWYAATSRRVHEFLTNPAHGGYYVLRISPKRKHRGTGLDLISLPPSEAIVSPGHHEGYVDQATWIAIQRTLASNRPSVQPPACKGKALCQGLVWCGTCEKADEKKSRLKVDYPKLRCGRGIRYKCTHTDKITGKSHTCCSLVGEPLETLVVTKVLSSVAPAAIDAVIAATAERRQDFDTTCEQREAELSTAQYEARALKKRYDSVDPDNTLVKVEVEKAWNAALLTVQEIELRHTGTKLVAPLEPTPETMRTIRRLTALPALWAAPSTRNEDRKAILRTLVDEIVVFKIDPTHVRVDITWKGAKPTTDVLALPWAAAALVRELFFNQGMKPKQIAEEVNRQGFRTLEEQKPYAAAAIYQILSHEFKKTGGRPFAAFRESLRPTIQALVDQGMRDWPIAEVLNAQKITPRNAASWSRYSVRGLRLRLGIRRAGMGVLAKPRNPSPPRPLVWNASIETLRDTVQQLVDHGMGDRVIAGALHMQGIPSPNSAPWDRESARYLRKKLGISARRRLSMVNPGNITNSGESQAPPLTGEEQ